MKVQFRGRELELWQGAHGSDLLSPDEMVMVENGDLALLEEHDGWVGLGGALRNNGKYILLDAKLARLRLLPSVDRLLANPAFETFPHQRVLFTARRVLDDLRDEIHNGAKFVPQMESIIKAILLNLAKVQEDICANTPSWMNPRVRLLKDPFADLSQALSSIAEYGNLALSRQHLIESGGQRVEDSIKEAGWVAVPLGTINRCKLSDFQKAVESGVNAMAFLTLDSYTLEGFVANVKPELLAVLALSKDIPLLYYPSH
jgi:hypothetical protein